MSFSIVCDLDNTLLDIDHVLNPLSENGFVHDDWEGRAKSLDKDTVVLPVLKTLQMYYNEGFQIFLLTSRPEHLREETELQLSRRNITCFDALIMSPENDPHYASSDWKVNQIKYLNKKFPVFFVLEDVDSNVSAIRRAGFDVWQVKPDHFSDRPRGLACE